MSDDNNKKEIKDSFSPYKFIDQDTLESTKCLIGKCPVCKDDIESLIIFDDKNFVCVKCRTYETSSSPSSDKAVLVERILNKLDKLMKNFDEMMPEVLQEIQKEEAAEAKKIRTALLML